MYVVYWQVSQIQHRFLGGRAGGEGRGEGDVTVYDEKVCFFSAISLKV